MKTLVRTLIVLSVATASSCSGRTLPPRAAPPAETLTIGPAAVAVHRDRFGVGAVLSNDEPDGVRDIELSLRFFANDELVLTTSDVLAFCPAHATCPWGASFGIDADEQRSIDSAQVTVARVGPAFDGGVLRPIDLRFDEDSLSFDQPPRRGVMILYSTKDGAPYFGMFRVHQSETPETVRLTQDELPVGPETRAIFYEGHIPEGMIAGGD